jgi:phage-related minor tail protein
MAKMFVVMQESAKRTQMVFDSVFGNLTSAIDNFVKTGKLSMKDLARSIIQDLIAIQMKAAMLRFLGSAFGSMFGASSSAASSYGSSGGISEHVFNPMARAAGGAVTNNTPYLVGERGPELFMPSGSGTIIPNNALNGMGGGQPSVVYNGPYIANMSAIDTQSAMQFLAKNKQGVWAANQSAQRSMPVSR